MSLYIGVSLDCPAGIGGAWVVDAIASRSVVLASLSDVGVCGRARVAFHSVAFDALFSFRPGVFFLIHVPGFFLIQVPSSCSPSCKDVCVMSKMCYCERESGSSCER